MRKDSKETRELILNSALELFLEKSYSHTSTNDIRKKAGNLSRGGLYYFFPKKEDILEALPEFLFKDSLPMDYILDDEKLNTIEKIRKLLYEEHKAIKNSSRGLLFYKLMSSPEFLMLFVNNLSVNTVPTYYQLILKGNADGSMKVKSPLYTAEVLPLLLNVWFNPTFFNQSSDDVDERIVYLENLLIDMGIPLLDDRLKDVLKQTWLLAKSE
ncbi:TetR family transcriptional regulator [Enterococcus avium]|uniref:TetR/AcrR family transcriptional regulator n=1 Tax=Enterococcus malodoratus TaxID=71451 RepID=UPI0008C3CD6B|nr:TetR/AcrR family transcriptional regulator [Enterococcus malodoratus]BBM18881.1 TetR family transcriptional regulator [Enterococcus avium]SET62046.1 transcriptional regulator, TetR family [Enterococcus malodoratus]